jgi:hypothetical protein
LKSKQSSKKVSFLGAAKDLKNSNCDLNGDVLDDGELGGDENACDDKTEALLA